MQSWPSICYDADLNTLNAFRLVHRKQSFHRCENEHESWPSLAVTPIQSWPSICYDADLNTLNAFRLVHRKQSFHRCENEHESWPSLAVTPIRRERDVGRYML